MGLALLLCLASVVMEIDSNKQWVMRQRFAMVTPCKSLALLAKILDACRGFRYNENNDGARAHPCLTPFVTVSSTEIFYPELPLLSFHRVLLSSG